MVRKKGSPARSRAISELLYFAERQFLVLIELAKKSIEKEKKPKGR